MFPAPSAVRPAPFALLKNSRQTERGASMFPAPSAVRPAPFALLKNSHKTERGASMFPAPSGGAPRTLWAHEDFEDQ